MDHSDWNADELGIAMVGLSSGLAACTRETSAASRVEEWRRGRVHRINRTCKQIRVTFDGLRFLLCERAGLL
jgi:hypothetical protein